MISLQQALSDCPRVIIINGPAGVGKTTTSRAVASLAASGACVHGDDLKNFIVCRTGAEATGLGYRNGARVASTFIEGGYNLVVFDYVFEDPQGVETFLDAYRAPAPVHLFTLWADLETVLWREGQRHDVRGPLGERVQACHRTIARDLDRLGHVIQTEHRDYREVALEVVTQACEGVGLVSSVAEPLTAV
jgi:predicted kinase